MVTLKLLWVSMIKNKMWRKQPQNQYRNRKNLCIIVLQWKADLRGNTAYPHGKFSNLSVLLHLVSLFLLLASTFSGDFVLNFRGRFLSLQP